MNPTATTSKGTDQRQTCCVCLRPVGLLPNGEVREYNTRTYIWDDGSPARRFHVCADETACTARISDRRRMGAL